ncbi:hypothetical protein Asppvi_001989 [Aspergillus pseudoviridinutans]|uniref:NAD dependent epimerase/dehydratase n=1 Tax=Aspergillus pseudoviridinutans TaxID=1517512 RepID=A0A9P3EY67_9EURO|nr:uncharacterized protein Asppvi_001989 [Aspergillus pseudoviridinutans]GIJ92711.1 hypothetical protein Asppvi_001989 [Aspergillus pseudoviridinutans]
MASNTSQSSKTSSTGQNGRVADRQVPMKVLALGYGRTGTRSLRDALLTLGYHHTYHTFDAVYVNPRECKIWLKGLHAKCDGVGKKFGREEFDQLLGHCQAVADMPAAYFAPELIQAYPDAKVILTIRDIDEWHESVKNTLQIADSSLISGILGFTAKILFMPNRWNYPMFQKLNKVLYDGDFKKNGRKSFEQHYDHVRSLVPPENLLEYHMKDGWEPLCRFLGKPIPAEPVPYINQREGFNKKFRDWNVASIQAQLKRVLDISAYAALMAWVGAALLTRLS